MKTANTQDMLTKDSTGLVMQAFLNHLGENFTSEYGYTHFSCDIGRKFIRIWGERLGTDNRSAWAFIDRETGDVLKPATWRAPAKHARGNVYDGIEDTNAYGCGKYGPHYMR